VIDLAIFSDIVIRKNSIVRKTRVLPSPGEVLVEVGDVVGPSAIVAKTDYLRESPRVIDLNMELQRTVTPDMVDAAIVKRPGDSVRHGEVLALFPSDTTGETIEICSPCNGVVQYVSRLRAKIIILEDPDSMAPMTVVDVSSILNMNPRALRGVCHVKEGDYVQEGQIIAGSPHSGKLELVYAPISGVIARICPRVGTIAIVRPMKTLKVLAQIPGKVIETIKHSGAIVSGFGSTFDGMYGIGGECFGELIVLADSPQDILEESGIQTDVEGKILVAGAGASYAAMKRAYELGARGIIAGGFNQMDAVSLVGREINIHDTEVKGLGFALIMTEGSGFMPMNHTVWEILNDGAGHLASLDGVTRFGPDIKRPWVFVDENSYDKEDLDSWTLESEVAKETSLHRPRRIMTGDLVRCLRQPYFGLWGVVVTHIPEKIRLESEEVMETVKVKLLDGRIVNVAETNLEVITPV
jgi:hypothetical protein